MEEKDSIRDDYLRYGDLWTFNLQTIEDIQSDIEKSLIELEREYHKFEPIYYRAERLVKILTSIYSSYNAIDGKDYLLKLSAVIQEYRERYTRKGIDLELLNFLNSKVTELRDKSFQEFPALSHEYVYPGEEREECPETSTVLYHAEKRPYKWVSFQRNRSWFISRFSDLELIYPESCESMVRKEGMIQILFKDRSIQCEDIFSKYESEKEPPKYFLALDGASNNYVATAVGKRVFSHSDIISPRIKPFPEKEHPWSPGHVRIFGRNHIVIR